MKTFFAAVILVIAFSFAGFAEELMDVILLKDGTKYEGYIIEKVPEKSLTIRTLQNVVYTIEISKIDKMYKSFAPEPDFYSKNYTEIGINLGTPAAFNLYACRWISPIGIGVSGMSFGKTNGLQGIIKIKIADNPTTSHSAGIIIGTSNIENVKNSKDKDGKIPDVFRWDYYGVAYNMNWKLLWLELGLSTGQGSFTSPQLMFQIGITKRLFGD